MNSFLRENLKLTQTMTPIVYEKKDPKRLMDEEIQTVLEKFPLISLSEMENVQLLDRIDRKYVLPIQKITDVLNDLTEDYRALIVRGRRLNHYRTLYFDTEDFLLYNLHINDRKNRYKVRSREYVDSQSSFLEVKEKTNKGRTVKSRIPIDFPISQMTSEMENWVNSQISMEDLHFEPKLWTNFTRITLVGINAPERVTLDYNLTVFNDFRGEQMNDIVIAEVKTEKIDQYSPFVEKMKMMHIHPQEFSKYTIGVSEIYDGMKKNKIKPTLLKISKIKREAQLYE
ncbi:MAG TPA: polyphosphate polymerase domain-containing protein [Flexilinea sp.]|nr:polyphosphate polymerase domain-containing protein [Flexilinea sp.]